jgi:hypothetical protein
LTAVSYSFQSKFGDRKYPNRGLLALSIEGAEALLAIWKTKISFHLNACLQASGTIQPIELVI